VINCSASFVPVIDFRQVATLCYEVDESTVNSVKQRRSLLKIM